jgi:hypothetical protein
MLYARGRAYETASVFSLGVPGIADYSRPARAAKCHWCDVGHVHLNIRDVEIHKKLWVEHFALTEGYNKVLTR